MPRQNRVTPFGEIIATPERGTFMGNRGCITDGQGRLRPRRWAGQAWIICMTEYKGQRLELWGEGLNTQLFFLDEATALAAGHRPCFRCRDADARRFRDAWLRGNPEAGLQPGAAIGRIDAALHDERLRPGGSKATYRARLGGVPQGAFVALDGEPGAALLVVAGALWRWSAAGYSQGPPLRPDEEANVLTPRSTANAIAAGYAPALYGALGSTGG